MVSPAEFIPLAEDTGLIEPIGDWVLERVCRQARAWQDLGLEVRSPTTSPRRSCATPASRAASPSG